MIPAGLERAREALEETLAVVLDAARLAVDEPLRLADLAAEGLDDRLVAEADAEGRHRGPSRRTISTLAPASAGRPGPGEMTRCVGASFSAPSASITSLRMHRHLRAELLEAGAPGCT